MGLSLQPEGGGRTGLEGKDNTALIYLNNGDDILRNPPIERSPQGRGIEAERQKYQALCIDSFYSFEESSKEGIIVTRQLIRVVVLVAVATLCCLGLATNEALAFQITDGPDAAKPVGKIYIVQVKGHPAVGFQGGEFGLAATKPQKGEKIDPNDSAVRAYVRHLTSQHDSVLSSVGAAGDKVYSYRYTFNGFAARLTPDQVAALEQNADVVQVWEDEIMYPTTNTSPAFLGLSGKHDLWEKKKLLGEDIVIGIIDTGIWPEHPSFADTGCDDDLKGKKGKKGKECKPYKYNSKIKEKDLDKEQEKAAKFGPPPASFNSSGCDFGNSAFNPLDVPFECQNKLVGARFYAGSFSTPGSTNPDGSGGDGAGLIPGEYLSARDNDGHGSHTASTAGGNLFVPASILGEDLGWVSGMAPRARIAAYKVCWNGTYPPEGFDNGCASSDSMAAIDQAVADGVDVINFSIGGSSTNFNGPDDMAFLFAADAGVFVATSNGNSGPGAQTTGTPAGVPWVTAVGAGEDDQVYGTGLDVSSPSTIADLYDGLEGNGDVSLGDTGDITTRMVPSVPADGCDPFTNPGDINGNIALVIRGRCSFNIKYNNAAEAGAQAIVVYNDGTAPDRIDPIVMSAPGTTIPGIMIGFYDGDLIDSTVAGGDAVTGTVGPSIQISREDRIAGFSSRGPNGGAPDIIKPDVTAPGVQILAAHTPTPNDGNPPGRLFQSISGTSMASPHVAGIGALILQKHPDWTPAMVRSALMTTARQDLLKTFGDDAADPFDIGAGHIVPEKALDPGLAYDAEFFDYLLFLCGAQKETQPLIVNPDYCDSLEAAGYSVDPSDLNLPSIGIGELVGTQTVTRTVTNTKKGKKKWHVSVDMPPGIDVSVNPTSLHLKEGEQATYEVTFTNDGAPIDEWSFGSLTWKSGKTKVRSPIAVNPAPMIVPNSVSGYGTDDSLGFDVSFGYDGPYQVDVDGLVEAQQVAGDVADGAVNWELFIVPAGTTLARFSLFDEDVGDGSGSDDLDLQVFGPDTAGYPFVGSSGSATSNEEVNVVNPAPGSYFVAVIDYASAPGPTSYTLFNFNLDGTNAGNAIVTAPASAVIGTTETVTVDWSALAPGTRYLGILTHSDGVNPLRQTGVVIDTQ